MCVPSEAANWQPKTDPHFTALCLIPWTEPQKERPNWRLAAEYKNSYCLSNAIKLIFKSGIYSNLFKCTQSMNFGVNSVGGHNNSTND